MDRMRDVDLINAKLDDLMRAIGIVHLECNTLIGKEGMHELAQQIDASFDRVQSSYDDVAKKWLV